jgi:hypothetical protein
MNAKTKFAAAFSALAIAATLALPSQAEARGRGWGIGLGLLGAGIVAGSVYAASQPTVYVDGGYRCRWVRNFDAWGNYVGSSKVCRHVYY